MFPPRDGLSMGISTPRLTFQISDSVLIYVWVQNQTDDEKGLLSCSMWWHWGINVYDSGGHVIRTRREGEQESGTPMQICGRNRLLRIPPHSCGPLQDEGNVTTDLRKERNLPAGNYFVTEKPLTLPLRGLSFAIVDKKPAPDNRSP
jgi:hypothetical protein